MRSPVFVCAVRVCVGGWVSAKMTRWVERQVRTMRADAFPSSELDEEEDDIVKGGAF